MNKNLSLLEKTNKKIVHKSKKGRERRRKFFYAKYFLKMLRRHKIEMFYPGDVEKLKTIYEYYRDRGIYLPEDRLFLKTLSYRTRAPSTISVSKEEYRVYKKECSRFLHLLEQIAKDYIKQYYRHFTTYIPSSAQDESTETSALIDIPTKSGWKFAKLVPYHDIKSKMEFEEKSILEYQEDQEYQNLSLQEKLQLNEILTISEVEDLYREEIYTLLNKSVFQPEIFTSFISIPAKKEDVDLISIIEGSWGLDEYIRNKEGYKDQYSSFFHLIKKIKTSYSFLLYKTKSKLYKDQNQTLNPLRGQFLEDQAQVAFYEKYDKVMEDFFHGVIRDGETVRHVSALEQQARDTVRFVLKEETSINFESETPQLLILSQDKTIVVKIESFLKKFSITRGLKKVPLRTNSELVVLSQNIDSIRTVLAESVKVGRSKSDENIIDTGKLLKDPSKKITKKQVMSYTLKSIPFLAMLLIPLFMGLLPQDSSITYDLFTYFPFYQVLIFTIGLVIYTWDMVYSRSRILYLLLSPIGLFIFIFGFQEIVGNFISLLICPVMVIPSVLLFKGQPKMEKIKLEREKSIKDSLYSLDLKFHESKLSLLFASLVILVVIFWIFFVYLPRILYIPGFLIIVSIVLFTKQAHFEKIKLAKQIRSGGVSKLRAVYYNVKNYRAAILILIFLVCMPLVFISASIIRINQPDLQFAQIPQESRIEATPLDYDALEYYSALDGLEELSINDAFLSKGEISTSLFESAAMEIRLIPEEVEPV